jgi:hypothetical protein
MLVVLLAAGLASEPFLTFLIGGIIYLASIPVSVWMQGQAKRRVPASEPMPTPALPASSHAGDAGSNSRSDAAH